MAKQKKKELQKMKVLVIGGGISDERDVSLRSAKAIFEAIGSNHQKTFYDWDGSSDWLDENLSQHDVVLPILHGEGGEDGQIQSILEKNNVPFLGSDSHSSKICMDKDSTQKMLKSNNILVPEYKAMSWHEYIESDIAQTPHVVKPVDGGSSFHTYINVLARDPRLAQIEKSFEHCKKMMVEEFIAGVEVTVPVLDGKELPLIEIVPPEGEFFDYNNKYNGRTKEICPSVNVSDTTQQQAKEIAQKCHKVLGCRHLSRVDMIINNRGRIYTLEVNTMPGMTSQSLFPKSAQVSGMSMSGFVDYLIQQVSNT